MKKVLIGIAGAVSTAWAACAFATAEEVGVIRDIYTNNSGYMAVWLQGAYPKAATTSECPSANGYAGLSDDAGNKDMKALLITAKATGQSVRVVVQGCEAGGAWYKIIAVYAL